MEKENDTRPPGSLVSIEAASWRDLNAVRRLEQACFPKDAWPLWDLIGVLTFPNVVRLKASLAGEMVGFIAADMRAAERLAWIATLAVLPEQQRKGIGGTLLHACEGRLRVPLIRLSVRASNQPALSLYTRFGYQKAGVWRRYYQDGEDAIVMEKQIPRD